jgi:hypothetical protein
VLGGHEPLELTGVEKDPVALGALVDRNAVSQVRLHSPAAPRANEIVSRLTELVALDHAAQDNRSRKELRKPRPAGDL